MRDFRREDESSSVTNSLGLLSTEFEALLASAVQDERELPWIHYHAITVPVAVFLNAKLDRV